MNRLFVLLTLGALSPAIPAEAQAYHDAPVTAPAGIDAQTLTPPVNQPASLMPSQKMAASPNEGPEERSLDQALGNATPGTAPLKPTPHSDAAIEDRITATVLAPGPVATAPAPAPHQVQPLTQVISGGMSRPSTTAPAASRWEGPQERALDQALPGTNLIAPQGAQDVESDEVRRLNGGSQSQ